MRKSKCTNSYTKQTQNLHWNETSWCQAAFCIRVKQIEKYFRNANKAFRVALRKLYKISISQLCECENQMEAYFEQWLFKLYFSELTKGHLSAWWICNTEDHTRACGFAHNLCKCSSINPQCDPSALWQITNRIAHPSDCKLKYMVYSDASFFF